MSQPLKCNVLFNNGHGTVDFQVLLPEHTPIIGIKYFPNHNHTPFKETLVTPSSPDSFDPVLDLTEMVFDLVSRKRNPFPILQPVVQKGDHGLGKIGNVDSGPWIPFGIEPVDQFGK